KAPHFKIRIRRAFSRGLVHHHHHHHHNGPVVISDVGQVLPPVVVHVRPPEILPASGANVVPAPVEPPSTPLTAAALQRHEALMQQQQVDHSASDAMAQAGIPASLSLGMSMHQGAVFGVVSTIAVEAMQITLAEKRGNVADQTASIASAAMRGAVVGAAGGGMALMLGPTAPTAIFVGYGLMREWMAQGYSWVHNEITGPVALNRAVEVSGSAAGGVAGAMAAATLLSGFGGVVVAAAAGCSGFAGSLGGREVASVCFDLLSSERISRSRSSGSGMSSSSRRSSRKSSRRRSKGWMPSEPQLLEAYSLLGVDPCCSNTELKHAFRRAVVLQDDAGCAPFRDVLRAMERIRSTRQTPLELDIRNLDSGTHENSRSCRSSLGATSLESDSQLASFIGGMAAHPASGVSF
ncbi:mok12, partial [Symbiodinium natans]